MAFNQHSACAWNYFKRNCHIYVQGKGALTQITASQNTHYNETTDMWSDKQVSITRLEYKSLYICYGCHTLAQPHSSKRTRRGAVVQPAARPDPLSGFPPKITGQLERNNQLELIDTCPYCKDACVNARTYGTRSNGARALLFFLTAIFFCDKKCFFL